MRIKQSERTNPRTDPKTSPKTPSDRPAIPSYLQESPAKLLKNRTARHYLKDYESAALTAELRAPRYCNILHRKEWLPMRVAPGAACLAFLCLRLHWTGVYPYWGVRPARLRLTYLRDPIG